MKLTDIKLKEEADSVHNRVGFSTNEVWSDDHMKSVWRWLLTNQSSPYYGRKTLLMKALLITPNNYTNFSRHMDDKTEYWMSYKYRRIRTDQFKKIIAGQAVMVYREGKDGRALEARYTETDDPTPLQIPPVYHGNVLMTHRGLQMSLARTDRSTPRGNREGRAKLTNPFNRR